MLASLTTQTRPLSRTKELSTTATLAVARAPTSSVQVQTLAKTQATNAIFMSTTAPGMTRTLKRMRKTTSTTHTEVATKRALKRKRTSRPPMSMSWASKWWMMATFSKLKLNTFFCQVTTLYLLIFSVSCPLFIRFWRIKIFRARKDISNVSLPRCSTWEATS